jgi:RNA polymerase-binding protein DksA
MQTNEQIDLAALTEQLEAERTQLQKQIAAAANPNQGNDYLNHDRSDLAGNYFRQDRENALRALKTQKLAQIDHALARIADGSYGACVDCGETIAPARLVILPAATHCMACQQN